MHHHPQPLPPFAVIYARVSREEQRKGHSFAGQIGELTTWLERSGVPLGGVFEEQSSGKTPPAQRPSLLDALEASQGGALVVWRLDRLSRDVVDALTLCKAHKIVTLSDGWHADPMLIQLRAMQAQAELGAIKARITMGLRAKKEAGAVLGHCLHSDPSAIIRAREAAGETNRRKRADWVRRVAPLVQPLIGLGLTQRGLAERLALAGVPLPRGGCNWTAARVCELLADMADL